MSTSDLTNQEKLEETYKLALENNHMLHQIQRRDRMAMTFRIIYWLAILGALGGAYYYIRPLIDSVASSGTRAQSIFQQFEELRDQFPETRALQQFMDQLRPKNTETSSTTAADQ